jgi:hypothetical protein
MTAAPLLHVRQSSMGTAQFLGQVRALKPPSNMAVADAFLVKVTYIIYMSTLTMI